MGLLDFFKSKKQMSIPSINDVTEKHYDFFAFKVHGVATISGVQKILEGLGKKLHEHPSFVTLDIQNDTLNVYISGTLVGHGDKQAKDKFEKYCTKKYSIQSLAVYGGDEGKSYGCKVRVKYFL